MVAPIQEASAIGHALTLRRPLRIDPVAEGWFAVDGTPTDCVNIAITHVLGGTPDLILSGINKGWNLGDDVTYSGTVSAALEGRCWACPRGDLGAAGQGPRATSRSEPRRPPSWRKRSSSVACRSSRSST